MTDTTTDTRPYLDLLYLGTALQADGTGYKRFETVTGGLTVRTGQFHAFTPKRSSAVHTCTPGYVYRVPMAGENGDSYVFGERKPLGPWPDAAEREAIQTASRAMDVKLDVDKRLAKSAKDDADMDATLAPLKLEYARLRGTKAKAAYEVLVLMALRGL